MTETPFYISVNLEHAIWYNDAFDSSKVGDRVTIDYETTNPVDNNAIICKTLSSEPLGYFPSGVAKILSCIVDKEQPFQMEGVIVSLEEKDSGYRYVPIICKISLKKELESKKFRDEASQVIESATSLNGKVVRVCGSRYLRRYLHFFENSMTTVPCSSIAPQEIIDLSDSPCRSTTLTIPSLGGDVKEEQHDNAETRKRPALAVRKGFKHGAIRTKKKKKKGKMTFQKLEE